MTQVEIEAAGRTLADALKYEAAEELAGLLEELEACQ